MVDMSAVVSYIVANPKVQFIAVILLLVQVILATDLELSNVKKAKFKNSPNA